VSCSKNKGFQSKNKENLNFGFTEVFDTEVSQEALFSKIAAPVILQY
jgi:hypothetical protein